MSSNNFHEAKCPEDVVFGHVLEKSIWYNNIMNKPELISKLNEITDRAKAEDRDLTDVEAEECDKISEQILYGS